MCYSDLVPNLVSDHVVKLIQKNKKKELIEIVQYLPQSESNSIGTSRIDWQAEAISGKIHEDRIIFCIHLRLVTRHSVRLGKFFDRKTGKARVKLSLKSVLVRAVPKSGDHNCAAP